MSRRHIYTNKKYEIPTPFFISNFLSFNSICVCVCSYVLCVFLCVCGCGFTYTYNIHCKMPPNTLCTVEQKKTIFFHNKSSFDCEMREKLFLLFATPVVRIRSCALENPRAYSVIVGIYIIILCFIYLHRKMLSRKFFFVGGNS